MQVSEDTVCKGANVIFNCSVTDASPMELIYQLYENNFVVSNSITGILNRSMTTGGVFGYKCKVNNTIGTVMSENVTITVNGNYTFFSTDSRKCPAAPFSKVPKTFRARNAISKTATRLFCTAGLLVVL